LLSLKKSMGLVLGGMEREDSQPDISKQSILTSRLFAAGTGRKTITLPLGS